MIDALIPIASASISAGVAAGVAWFSSRRAIRLEVDKLRLGAEQTAHARLLDARLQCYPELYGMLSDLLKYAQGTTDAIEMTAYSRRISRWDSKHAILLGPEASNICYRFRAKLKSNMDTNPTDVVDSDLLKAAANLELALRSDLGIYGFGVAAGELVVRLRSKY